MLHWGLGVRCIDMDPRARKGGVAQAGGAKMFAMKPSAIRARVVTLAGRRNDNFWELGNALLMLRDSSRYTGDFKRTVKHAGLNLRQAYYLCEIVDRLRPFARYKERFEAIGWTKTQVIARGLNKQNLKQRLEWAETKGNSTRKLPILMKGETEPPEQKRVVLYFTKDEYEAFKQAVEQNGGSIAPRKNLVGKEVAVMALIKKAALSQ
jgi:predicted enzyme related to lactoylglutathione lyase